MLVIIASSAGLIGIALAYFMYVLNPALPESLAQTLSAPYKLIYNKFFVDELYDATVVTPIVSGSRGLLWKSIDVRVIDGLVNGVGATARFFGGFFKLVQSGNIRSYATWVVFGAVVLIVAMGAAVLNGGGVR
jgi:NADH-quinone oxidoreductase subunit L